MNGLMPLGKSDAPIFVEENIGRVMFSAVLDGITILFLS